MQNEVYGTVTIDVSVPTDESNETMALLKENFKYSPYTQARVVLLFEDMNGKMIEATVHNYEILLNRFFGEDE